MSVKKITVLLFGSIAIAVLISLLNNCAQKHRRSGNPNDPNDPTYQNGGYGFNPDELRGGESFQYSSDGNGNTHQRQSSEEIEDPLYKSPEILRWEKRWGSSAALEIDQSVFEDFRLGIPVNDMDDIVDARVFVNLQHRKINPDGNELSVGYGKVSIGYCYDSTNQCRLTTFDSGSSEKDIRYNIWFWKGKMAYHGFFLGPKTRGSLILVIDRITNVLPNPDDPDSNQQNFYGGSIWIMQFRTTFHGEDSCSNHSQRYVHVYNQNPSAHCSSYGFFGICERLKLPSKRCWRINGGPFDCRTWRKSGAVDTHRAIEPDDNCYKKLATFEGLHIPDAFHVNNKQELFP